MLHWAARADRALAQPAQALEVVVIVRSLRYAYVNPVAAVGAGWALLGEQVTATMAAGATLILGAVVLVVRERA